MCTILLTTLLASAVLGGSNTEDVLPTFEWNSDGSLTIDFNDGGLPDVANLQRIRSQFGKDADDDSNNECMMTGFLSAEPTVAVRVLGCPGQESFQVILNSQRIIESTFMVHQGQVTAFHLDPNQESAYDDDSLATEILDAPDRLLNTEDREASERNLPSAFTVTMSVSYDDLFLNEVCGGDHDLAKSRVEKIVSLAQAYYMDETTLGTKVYFSVKEIGHVPYQLKLSKYGDGWPPCNTGCVLRNAIEKLSAYNPLDVDHYHYISADNPRGSDTSGVAKVMGYYGWKYDGTVCWPAKKERTAITEFWGNPKDWDGGKLNAGLVFAHELGHSLGMPHDFLKSDNDPRLDESGNSCLGTNGIMSYKGVRTTWSTSSKEAIRGWFKQLSDMKMNCMDDREPPVDCSWGDWSEYSTCSVTCGGAGTQTRTRSKAVEASGGGFDCAGPTEETTSCNNGECGGNSCVNSDEAWCSKYEGRSWFYVWCVYYGDVADSFFGGMTLKEKCKKSCGDCGQGGPR